MSEQKLVTQPHNPFLLEAYNAFVAEGAHPAVAAAMTQAHVSHGAAKVAIDQARSFERIAASLEQVAGHLGAIRRVLTDPVELGRVLALIRAADAKRSESASDKGAKAAADAFDALVRASGEELAS